MTNSVPIMDAFASALTMLTALQAGQVSAAELLELYTQRIARYNPQVNAIVIPNEEQAHRQAVEADAAYARGESLGALHGLPLTIKDSIEVAGLRTTAALPHAPRSFRWSTHRWRGGSLTPVGSCSARPTCHPMLVTGRPIIRSLGGPTTPGI